MRRNFFRIFKISALLGILFFPPAAGLAWGDDTSAADNTRAVFNSSPAAAAFPSSSPAAAGPGTAANAYNQIIHPESLIISKKTGYLFMVWDVFPLRDRFAPGDKTRDLASLRYAAYLAFAYGFLKYPGYPEARVNLIAFKTRDEYGGPRWDLAEKWHLYTFRADRFGSQGITQPESLWNLPEKKLNLLLAPLSGQNQ